MQLWMIKTIYGFDIVAQIDDSKSTATEYAVVNPLRYDLVPHEKVPGSMREQYAEIANSAKAPMEAFMLQKVHVFLKYEPVERIETNWKRAIDDMRMKRSGIVDPNEGKAKGLIL